MRGCLRCRRFREGNSERGGPDGVRPGFLPPEGSATLRLKAALLEREADERLQATRVGAVWEALTCGPYAEQGHTVRQHRLEDSSTRERISRCLYGGVVNVIAEVERFKSKCQLEALANREGFCQPCIDPKDLVDVQAAHGQEWHAIPPAATVESVAGQGDAREDRAGAGGNGVVACCDGMGRGERGDGRKLPPVHDVPAESPIVAHEFRLPHPVDGCAVPLVQSRTALVESPVARNRSIIEGVRDVPGSTLFIAIVDSMRPGVGNLGLEVMGEALLKLEREGVVPALPAVLNLQNAAVPRVEAVRQGIHR